MSIARVWLSVLLVFYLWHDVVCVIVLCVLCLCVIARVRLLLCVCFVFDVLRDVGRVAFCGFSCMTVCLCACLACLRCCL